MTAAEVIKEKLRGQTDRNTVSVQSASPTLRINDQTLSSSAGPRRALSGPSAGPRLLPAGW